jgi:hypothetical protein
MLTKKNIHSAYLLISAFVILHGTFLLMSAGGTFSVYALRMYTPLSNYLVAFSFIALFILYNHKGKVRSYISASAIVSITVTGLVYNLILVPAIPEAEMILSDYPNFVTHFFSMVLALFNYFFFEKKGEFSYKHILAGMAFPFIYWVVFISIGGMIDFFPYFFMNPTQIGWGMTFIWFGIILTVIAVLGFLLVRFDKMRGRKAKD